MIQEFVTIWNAHKHEAREAFAAKHPEEYRDVVRHVVTMLHKHSGEQYSAIDPENIHVIDDGHYQGTLVFVIAGGGYQPSDYWYVKVSYGSCSGCDTLQGIRGYEDPPPSDEQIDQYMTLALHIVQGLRKMGDSDA